MLFFDDILEDRLSDPSFNALFERECHICAVTMAVVSRLEQDADLRAQVLSTVKMSPEAYDSLVRGDECNPSTIAVLCRELGMDHPDMEENCPRL